MGRSYRVTQLSDHVQFETGVHNDPDDTSVKLTFTTDQSETTTLVEREDIPRIITALENAIGAGTLKEREKTVYCVFFGPGDRPDLCRIHSIYGTRTAAQCFIDGISDEGIREHMHIATTVLNY